MTEDAKTHVEGDDVNEDHDVYVEANKLPTDEVQVPESDKGIVNDIDLDDGMTTKSHETQAEAGVTIQPKTQSSSLRPNRAQSRR